MDTVTKQLLNLLVRTEYSIYINPSVLRRSGNIFIDSPVR